MSKQDLNAQEAAQGVGDARELLDQLQKHVWKVNSATTSTARASTASELASLITGVDANMYRGFSHFQWEQCTRRIQNAALERAAGKARNLGDDFVADSILKMKEPE